MNDTGGLLYINKNSYVELADYSKGNLQKTKSSFQNNQKIKIKGNSLDDF